MGLKIKTILATSLLLTLANFVSSNDETSNFDNIWEQISNEGNVILKKSFNALSKLTDQFSIDVDKEISNLQTLIDEQSKLDMEDKIDSIRFYVEEIGNLKKKELGASNFTIISKSKKDYRIDIDNVLEEIEPILFDGQILNYAERIRDAKSQIREFEDKKVKLNEKLILAPDENSLFNTSKSEIRSEIEKIELLSKKSEKLIDKLEFDLKRKMRNLGIDLSREQIRVITTRIDGDDLAKSFAIFDVTKQISETLGEMMQRNSFSGSATTNYYGVYVILSEILRYSQLKYIQQINETYLPAINIIEKDILDSIAFAKKSQKEAKSNENKKIFKSNIEANEFSLMVLEQYEKIMISQLRSLENAVSSTTEQISVAYSTYDTAVNSSNIVNLISQTQDNFNKIMDMQLPEIIPFENNELESKFNEISAQLIMSSV